VVTLAVDFGLIEQSGAWYKYEEEKFNGKGNLVNMFRENTEMYDGLRGRVKDMLGLSDE